MELPFAEDIYDFDTFTLEDTINKIADQLNLQNEDKWVRKANKILYIARLEIKERQAVEQFGAMCFTKNFDYFLEDHNPYE